MSSRSGRSRSAMRPTVRAGRSRSGTELKPIARGTLDDHVVVRELSERLNDVADRARERMDRLGEIDAASQDVIIEVVRALEQQLWMVRVQFGHAVQS